MGKIKCLISNAPPKNLETMSSYIYSLARGSIVVIDNNIIPDANSEQLKDMTADSISGIAKYNQNLVRLLRDFSSDRVIVTPCVRQEALDGIAAVKGAIGQIKGRTANITALVELSESYKFLEEQLKIEKRLPADYSAGGKVYDSLMAIARKIIQDNPALKKDALPGKNEADEKMVAYAFAQAVKQDQKAYIFSSDLDVKNIAKELYQILIAKNIVGVDIITGQRLKSRNIEVMRFDPSRNLFQSAVDAQAGSAENWVPDYYSPEELKGFVKFVQKILVPAEIELGNGKALAELVAQKEKDMPPIAPKEHSEEAEETTAEISATVEQAEKSATNVPSAALERIYQRLKVNPADLENADQSKIENAIKDYEALIDVYSCTKVSTSKLEQELEQLRGKSVVYQVAQLTKDTGALVAEMNEITKDTNYFKSTEKRNKFAELTAQINENAGKLDGLEQSLKQVQSVTALASMNPTEKELYDAFQAKGFVITEEGVIVNSEQLTEITQRQKASLYGLLSKMEKEVGLERNSNARPATYRIALKHLPYLIKKR